MADAPRITVEELKRRIDAGEAFTFIDTRNPTAWGEAKNVIPGALRIMAEAPREDLSRVPRDKPIVTYCT